MGCAQIAFWGGAPGGFELLLVFAAILILFGARRLPEIARTVGRLLEQARRSAQQVSDEITAAGEEPPPPIERDDDEPCG